jgi:predicted MFS family arabinose efflux permease
MTSKRGSTYRWIVLALLAFAYVLNFLDRQLLAILAKPIQDDLGISDGQIGLLGGFYFALFYCTISLPVAWLADRGNRVRVVAIACAIWSAATLACGLSRSYSQLVAARMMVGVGEAGGVPPSYSIISDYFEPESRGRALALFNLGAPIGQALGVAFGAGMAAAYDWRSAFVAMGVIGIVAAAILALVVREPVRGTADRAAHEPSGRPPGQEDTSGFRDVLRLFLTQPRLWLTALAAGIAAFLSYAMLNFAALFLMREKGMTLEEVGLYYAMLLACSIGGGIYISGWLVDRLGPKGERFYAIIPAVALALAIPFFVGFVEAETWQTAILLLILPTFLGHFFLTPAVAFVQLSVRPSERTLASAMFLFVINMIGLGLGPTYLGAMSDAFRASAPETSLQIAFHALTPFYLITVGLYFYLARIIRNQAPKVATPPHD